MRNAEAGTKVPDVSKGIPPESMSEVVLSMGVPGPTLITMSSGRGDEDGGGVMGGGVAEGMKDWEEVGDDMALVEGEADGPTETGTVETDGDGPEDSDGDGIVETDVDGRRDTDDDGGGGVDGVGAFETDDDGADETDAAGVVETDGDGPEDCEDEGTVETDDDGDPTAEKDGTVDGSTVLDGVGRVDCDGDGTADAEDVGVGDTVPATCGDIVGVAVGDVDGNGGASPAAKSWKLLRCGANDKQHFFMKISTKASGPTVMFTSR